jgi:hypothetical protein
MALNGKKAFGYDPGSAPAGVEKKGDLAILTADTIVQGITWWAPPDSSTGYVISVINPDGNQPNPKGIPAYNGFYRSQGFSNAEFIKWVNVASGNNFTDVASAQNWVDNNNSWSNYEDDYPTLNNYYTYAQPRTDTSNPFTIQYFPPGGTPPPNAVVVFANNHDSTIDRITSVTYGGVAMTRITGATDNSGEVGNVQAYFLGSNIPSSYPQDVVINFDSATADDFYFIIYTLENSVSLDTQVIDYKIVAGDTVNPQVSLITNGYPCKSICYFYTGSNAATGFIELSGMTTPWSADEGLWGFVSSLSVNTNTSSFTIGYTLPIDDVAFVALNIASI